MENGPFREEKRFYNRGFSIVMLNFWGVLPTNCYTARNDFLIGWFETNSWLLLRMTRFWGTLQHYVSHLSGSRVAFGSANAGQPSFLSVEYKCSCCVQVSNEAGNMSFAKKRSQGEGSGLVVGNFKDTYSTYYCKLYAIWHGHRVLRSGARSKSCANSGFCFWFCKIGMFLYQSNGIYQWLACFFTNSFFTNGKLLIFNPTLGRLATTALRFQKQNALGLTFLDVCGSACDDDCETTAFQMVFIDFLMVYPVYINVYQWKTGVLYMNIEYPDVYINVYPDQVIIC